MLTYTISHIAKIIGAKPTIYQEATIEHLLTDSRKLVFADSTLFFALPGLRRNGADYLLDLYLQGVRNFVLADPFNQQLLPEANLLYVKDVLTALQDLAIFHRGQFQIPVIGITGSNGKTMVKEWLYQLLQTDFHLVRSPRSYNSQIGVPLSVWQINERHQLAIIEAGISEPNEMDRLAKIIQPSIGILTNIGDAHAEGFSSEREKAEEKAILFSSCKQMIYAKDRVANHLAPETKDHHLFSRVEQFISWSRNSSGSIQLLKEETLLGGTQIQFQYQGELHQTWIPFKDLVSIENAMTCYAVLLAMGYAVEKINEKMKLLESVSMRMQVVKGNHNSTLINDSYSNDLAALDMALDYLQQQAGKYPKIVILSDLLQARQSDEELYASIVQLLKIKSIDCLMGIGPALSANAHQFKQLGIPCTFYPTTTHFIEEFNQFLYKDAYVLLKGARLFEFERIVGILSQQVHQTLLTISLSMLGSNLKKFQSLLAPSTKMMAVVKAFGYGVGSVEIARLMQFHQIDYLAVAYADEGVALRKSGIHVPIMVMNVDAAGFDALVNYQLEPEIFSFSLFQQFHRFLLQEGVQQFPIHIKFNTGMNRLGFELNEVEKIGQWIQDHHTMAVKSVFSHLVASEDHALDAISQEQVNRFLKGALQLRKIIGYDFLKHIANTAAISRNPNFQMDMVRLGIGMYGVDPGANLALDPVATLTTTIAQIRHLAAGSTVGYNQSGILKRDSKIATVRIGYADGFHRIFSNGKGAMWVNGKLAPVVGTVCMDMTMIDITEISNVGEGDRVEVFGPHLSLATLAKWSDTIPYEILCSVSQRVKRIYQED